MNYDALTDEEIDVKVAERLGWVWTPLNGNPHSFSWEQKVFARACWVPPGGQSHRPVFLPPFATSLDACSQFERTLTEWEDREYRDILIKATCCAEHRASPRQRCIAYLKVKSL